MTLDFAQFSRASSEVERIIFKEGEIDLHAELEHAISGITDRRAIREFYRHMNTLFLNVLLNRLDDVGRDKEQRVIDARRIIVELLNSY